MSVQEATCTSIGGYQVSFPYKPYDTQVEYMRKAIEACENSQFALLESPTGTGKTLSILCSTLTWREQSNTRCQIVYSSRTHSQLSNVITELKKTRFTPRVAHIASRKLLCINHHINKYDNFLITRLCHNLRSKKQCPYGLDENLMSNSNKVLTACQDIEEYIEACANHMICPYFAAQINSEHADLILTPYSYIVDPNVCQFLSASTMIGNVIIFDEAHNFADTCSDAYSAQLHFSSLYNASQTLSKIDPGRFSNVTRHSKAKVSGPELMSTKIVISNLSTKCSSLIDTDDEFREICRNAESSSQSVLYVKKTTEQLYTFLREAGLSKENARVVYQVLDMVVQKGEELELLNNEFGSIQSLLMFIDLVFPEGSEATQMFDDYFSIQFTSNQTISILCFSPAIAMKKVSAFLPRTMILTSGTLSPLSSLENALEYKFPIKLECNHIVNPENFIVAVANSGISGLKFNFSYRNRKGNERLRTEVVDSISELFTIAPSGALLFFPSFSYMNDISPSIVNNCSRKKRIYVEAKEANKQATVLENYKRDAAKGACLCAVCRGRSSEGLDFIDDFARLVGVVGIPYPSFTDYSVTLKRNWLDAKSPGKGTAWYNECAIRAVNQCIGRAIRHKNDYACIVLFDERFSMISNDLSKWMQPSVFHYDDWSTLTNEVEQFFRSKKEGFVMRRSSSIQSALSSQRVVSFSQSSDFDDVPSQKQSQSTSRAPTQRSQTPSQKEGKATIVHLITKENKTKKKEVDKSKVFVSFLSQRKEPKSSQSDTAKHPALTQTEVILRDLWANKQPKPMLRSVSQPQVIKEKDETPQECLCCKEKNKAKLLKLSCGHSICIECRKIFKEMDISCPICKK